MRQVFLLLLLLLLPVFAALGMYGVLPCSALSIARLTWLLVAALVLFALIQKLAPRIQWARTRQVSLSVVSAAAVLVVVLAIVVSWLALPATVWLLVLIPTLVGFVLLALWMLTTAFGTRDLSKYFVYGFLLISVLLDGSVWFVLVRHGANL